MSEVSITFEEDGYEEFENQIKNSLENLGNAPLFTTDAAELFDLYLSNLPEDKRQHYNCHACRNFINKFGALITISEQGEVSPVMWMSEVPPLFQSSVRAIREAVLKSNVTGVFLTKEKVLGTPVTGSWSISS